MALLIRLGLSSATDPAAEQPAITCFIANLVRCNPPANRAPTPAEVEHCRPFLLAELAAVRPAILVTLGLPATRFAFAELMGRRADRLGPLAARPIAPPPDAARPWPQLLIPARHPSRASHADWRRLERVLAAALARRS
jgi:DNA polymerase